MKTQIIEHENKLISEMIQDCEIKISVLKGKLNKLDFTSSFSDGLNKHFYGGMVGYMSKKDNARKSRELEKHINTCNTKRSIEKSISSTEFELKKLLTGRYLLRKNGLLVESYKHLNELLTAVEEIISTGLMKGKPANAEELSNLKDFRKTTKTKIKQREKLTLKNL